jgi:hypothetical protein
MTIEQKEQTILTLLAELPLFRRVKIAFAIIKGVEPEQVLLGENVQANETVRIGESAANLLNSRISHYQQGEDQGKDAWESLAKIRQDFTSGQT